MNRDKLHKLTLYFESDPGYWRLNDQRQPTRADGGPLGRHPLRLTDRLDDGHFDRFDEEGLPLRGAGAGIHGYTTIAAWGLANWDRYLDTGDALHAQRLLTVAGYFLRTGHPRGEGLEFRADLPGRGHTGALSAMVQGQAMSVFCRAWLSTREQRYVDAAAAALAPMLVRVEDGGVLGRIDSANVSWLEEWPEMPGHHAFNGAFDALWGANDLALVSGHAGAKSVFEEAVESVVAVLPLVDTGFWSSYGVRDGGHAHIASAQYHNKHVCLLEALAAQTGNNELADAARRFAGYTRNPLYRMRAAAVLARTKLVRRFRRTA
ncbi:MAG TPA: D-glucuronyl C5-epimerase family protein [Thermoanaerobaculia bacterium]|nr:D-glucuronyl C5-epimerase family protein [Thermoanaerobaculia bacterium]